MLELEFAQLSDPGKVRGHNEDFIGYAEPSTPEQARTHGPRIARQAYDTRRRRPRR